MQPVFRFAPSPNGFLHAGHAYSALLNAALARQAGGRLLLRIEDIDTIRCRQELVDAVFEDLDWLGLTYEQPVLRQSTQFDRYRAVLSGLADQGLVYPCFCSRKAIRAAAGAEGASDPDGAPLYPGLCRGLSPSQRQEAMAAGAPFCWRLDMERALARCGGAITGWSEWGEGLVPARPEMWGDVILGRKETPTSYHLAVVLDDALQGITDIARGRDLYYATSVHRLLQTLLGLPAPRYRHHPLLRDDAGEKLAKSRHSTPIRTLRAEGISAAALRRRLGFV